jgi:hypothetical protein
MTTTDPGGYYRFDDLPAGSYVVEIPTANFKGSGPLVGLGSSAVDESNPNADGDRNDNGLGVAGAIAGVRSGVVTLGPGASEPTGETDIAVPNPPGEAANPRSNLTVDFGFWRGFSLGNRVWLDDGSGGGTANNGMQDGTERGLGLVRLNLLDAAGNPVLDGAGNPIFTTTDPLGFYRFDSLPSGNYLVEVASVNFLPGGVLAPYQQSQPKENDPNANVDENNNGLGRRPGLLYGVRSGVVTLGVAEDEPQSEPGGIGPDPSGNAPDPRSNLTVDFGFLPLERIAPALDGFGLAGALAVLVALARRRLRIRA